jgi:integrase
VLARKAQVAIEAVLARPDPDRSVGGRAEAWYQSLIAALNARTMSVGRYGAYRRNLNEFVGWIGPEAAIEAIDSLKLEAWYAELSGRVAAGTTSPDYARNIFGATKMFISWLSGHGLLSLPGNLSNRRFKFGKGKLVTRADLFTAEEIRFVLSAAGPRLRLFLLLMLNAGMYQGDISDLGEDEVDWEGRTITRARSKTGGQVVRYRLWPETLALLKECRHAGNPVLNARGAPRVLLTTEGKPLTAYWLENGKERRYDTIQSLYSTLKREAGSQKPMKSLRKTAASELATHPSYKFYVQYYLGHSPRSVAEQHYLVPSDEEFFEALEWLRGRLGLSGNS